MCRYETRFVSAHGYEIPGRGSIGSPAGHGHSMIVRRRFYLAGNPSVEAFGAICLSKHAFPFDSYQYPTFSLCGSGAHLPAT